MKIDKTQLNKMKVGNYWKIDSRRKVVFSETRDPSRGFYNRVSPKALKDFKQILKSQE